MDITDLFKMQMAEKKMNMRVLANAANINFSYVSRIFNGSRKPSLRVAYAIAKALDIDKSIINREYDLPTIEDEGSTRVISSKVTRSAVTMIAQELDSLVNGKSDPVISISKIVDKILKIKRHAYLVAIEDDEIHVYEMPNDSTYITELYIEAYDIKKYLVVPQITNHGNLDVIIDTIDEIVKELKEWEEDESRYSDNSELITFLEDSI